MKFRIVISNPKIYEIELEAENKEKAYDLALELIEREVDKFTELFNFEEGPEIEEIEEIE